MNVNEKIYLLIGAYIIIINIYAAAITVHDKRQSRKTGAQRVPEKRLFAAAALGGAPLMYITMLRIRHKTKHKRFMAGIPLIMAAHIFLAAFFILKIYPKI